MRKINKHIEIVSSTMPGLGSMGKKTREAIHQSLSRRYYKVGITIVNDLQDLDDLVALGPDLVFLGMKFMPADEQLGFNGIDKVWISDYLTERGITCTGSNSKAHRLELNKHLAKQCALDGGLPTSSFYVVKAHRQLKDSLIKQLYPMFVKPANRGGGLGIDSDSVVHNLEELNSKVNSISKELGSDSLIEQYLPGREFSVAVMYSEAINDYLVMPIELIAPQNNSGDRLLGKDVKNANKTGVLELVEKSMKKDICNLALNIFHALGARDYGRIDIRLDQHNAPQFLEANLIPSLLAGYGSFPLACVINMGLEFDSMIQNIVELAFERPLGSYERVGYTTEITEPSFV